jgi:uncharacterized membrane protein YkvA (DUF1232 family)
VDLIPDFIPVIGYLDDLILVPAGIYLAVRMVPRDVLADCRKKAVEEKLGTKAKVIAATVVVLTWLLVVYLIVKAVWLD